MQTKWTPGPWKADRIGEDLYISPINGGFVADMQRDACENDKDRARCDADAHLIAAAPAMYEALTRLEKAADVANATQHAGLKVLDSDWSELRAAQSQARAALAAARGEVQS